MKILQMLSTCQKGSGIEEVVMRYYKQVHLLVAFDFLVFTEGEDSYKNEIECLGGRVYCSGKPGLFSLAKYKLFLNDFFKKHEGEYDMVHLHDVFMNWLVFPIAKQYGVKVCIVHSHATKFSNSVLGSIRNRIMCAPVGHFADVFFACSKDAGIAIYGKRIVESDTFYVINNAMDLSKYAYSEIKRQNIRREFNIQDTELVIGHIGIFAPQKNHAFLIRIFAEYSKEYPETRLLLVGSGTLFNEIKSLSKKLDIEEKVIFTGQRIDVDAVLSAMDVLCFPSLNEGLGCVLIEAQANSLGCVVSDVIPKEAIISPNVYSLSLSAGIDQWIAAINKAALNRSEDNKHSLIEAGFEISSAGKRLFDIYKSLLS